MVEAAVDEVARTEIEGLKDDLREHKQSNEKAHDRLSRELAEFRRMYAGRPTWGVTVALGALLSLSTGLLTILLRR